MADVVAPPVRTALTPLKVNRRNVQSDSPAPPKRRGLAYCNSNDKENIINTASGGEGGNIESGCGACFGKSFHEATIPTAPVENTLPSSLDTDADAIVAAPTTTRADPASTTSLNRVDVIISSCSCEPDRMLMMQLRNEVINAIENAREFQKEYERIQEEGQSLYAAYTSKSNRLKDMKVKQEQMQIQLQEKDKEIESLKRKLVEADFRANEWKEKHRAQAQTFKENFTSFKTLKTEHTKLLNESSAERLRLQSEIDTLKKTIAEVQKNGRRESSTISSASSSAASSLFPIDQAVSEYRIKYAQVVEENRVLQSQILNVASLIEDFNRLDILGSQLGCELQDTVGAVQTQQENWTNIQQESQAHIGNLQHQKADLLQQTYDLHNRNSALENQLESLQQEICSQGSELRNQLRGVEQMLLDKRDEVDRVRQELAMAQEFNRQQIEQLQSEHRATLQSQLEKLHSQFESQYSSKLESQISVMSEKYGSVVSELAEKRAINSELADKLQKRIDQAETLQEQLHSHIGHITELHHQLRDVERSLSEKQEEATRAKKDIETLREQHQQLVEFMQVELQTEKELIVQERNNAVRELKECGQRIEGVLREKAALEASLQQQSLVNTTHENQIGSMQQKLESQVQYAQKLETQICTLNEKQAFLQANLEKEKAANTDLLQNLRERDEHIDSLQQQLQSHDQYAAELTDQLRTLGQSNAEKQNEVDHAKQDFISFQEAQRQHIERMQSEYQAMRNSILQDRDSALKELSDRLEKAGKQMETVLREKAALEAELHRLMLAGTELQEQLQTTFEERQEFETQAGNNVKHLERQVMVLSEKCETLVSDLSQQRNINSSQGERLRERESQLESAQEQIRSQTVHMTKSRDQLRDLERSLTEKRDELDGATQVLTSMQESHKQQLERLQSAFQMEKQAILRDREIAINTMAEKLNKAGQQMDEVIHEKACLEHELRQKSLALSVVENEKKQLMLQLDLLMISADPHKQLISTAVSGCGDTDVQMQLRRLAQDKLTLEREVTSLRVRYEAVCDDIKHAQQEIEKLKSQRDESKQRAEECAQSMAKTEQELDQLDQLVTFVNSVLKKHVDPKIHHPALVMLINHTEYESENSVVVTPAPGVAASSSSSIPAPPAATKTKPSAPQQQQQQQQQQPAAAVAPVRVQPASASRESNTDLTTATILFGEGIDMSRCGTGEDSLLVEFNNLQSAFHVQTRPPAPST